MLAAIASSAVLGIDALDVIVEVHVTKGLPQWTLVGLAATAVKESRERVSAALLNSGYQLPPRRITVSLSPGDLPKAGTAFDLPIALGVLVASGCVDPEALVGVRAVGELGLDGTLRPVRGVLAVARRAALAEELLIVPPGNLDEAACVPNCRIAAPSCLAELASALRARDLTTLNGSGTRATGAAPTNGGTSRRSEGARGYAALDMSDVVGQPLAIRALEIAAAGGHNSLLVGPPGTGKTMLARRLPGIMPPLSSDEALEVLSIHSVAGLLAAGVVSMERPFRAPHHSVSAAGLVGGGSLPRPGEVSLAHGGVLFLDELSLFPRHVLEAMRQPLEDGFVTHARAATSVRFPAQFMLAAATNPCPCGFAGDAERTCTCAASDIDRHRARLSGPFADRIDLHVHVRRVPPALLDEEQQNGRGTSSSELAERVVRARALQRQRYEHTHVARAHVSASTNATVPQRQLAATCALDREARALLGAAADRLRLSARSYHRVLRVARTIADLDGDRSVGAAHIAESLRFRPLQLDSVL